MSNWKSTMCVYVSRMVRLINHALINFFLLNKLEEEKGSRCFVKTYEIITFVYVNIVELLYYQLFHNNHNSPSYGNFLDSLINSKPVNKNGSTFC